MLALNPSQIVLHGIPNCDTVKRARAWLMAQGIEHEFVDFKKSGVPPARLDAWLAGPGWQLLLNRQGTTWRRLAAAEQASITDASSARALLLAQPSLIKRPVVDWPGGVTTVGWDAMLLHAAKAEG